MRNFRCFRDTTTISLADGAYFVGPNNSGKTAALSAIRCFFSTEHFQPDDLNKTALSRRQAGFNRSDITLELNLDLLTGPAFKRRMIGRYGSTLAVTKSISWRELSGPQATYTVAGRETTPEDLDPDVRKVIGAIAISYIHPQEGAALLSQAQEKFRQRLFKNWGRHASVADKVREIQAKWAELRATANTYLSSTLTARLRAIWPQSQIKIDLPERIESVVAISDIVFRTHSTHPEVSLASHGTGAQSLVLYQTHHILDSDRSLHQGLYFPVWLLEEPESFLHADIAFQLGRLLASPEWLQSIQIITSTHSPVILAGSQHSPSRVRWVVFHEHAIAKDIEGSVVTRDDVEEVGRMMGDANFDVYFATARRGPVILIEDSRPATSDRLRSAGVPVTGTLGGVSEVKRYLAVLATLAPSLYDVVTIVVDGDKGLTDLKAQLAGGEIVASQSGWQKIRIYDNVYVITLPVGAAMEDLYSEWPATVDEAVDDLYEARPWRLRAQVPTDLTRAASAARARQPADREAAAALLRYQQDVKDRFWLRVEAEGLAVDGAHVRVLQGIL